MPIYDTSPKHKRANLFLLRVWCDGVDENGNRHEHEYEHGNTAGSPSRAWHGKVQRTVSGEEHSFGAKEDLIGVLEAMIYNDRSATDNNQTEANEAT
jgi:hypothetical protein